MKTSKQITKEKTDGFLFFGVTLLVLLGSKIPALVLEGGTIFSIRTRLREGINRFAIERVVWGLLRLSVGFKTLIEDRTSEGS